MIALTLTVSVLLTGIQIRLLCGHPNLYDSSVCHQPRQTRRNHKECEPALHHTIPLSGCRPFRLSNHRHILVQRAYVVYPPESQRPPSYEELAELRNKAKKQ